MTLRPHRLFALLLLLLSACNCESVPMLDAAMTSDADIGSPEICDNGLDDDGDGALDCEDVACIAQDMAARDERTVDIPFLERVRFLWEGGVCPPIQTDAVVTALTRRDIAAVHGRVTGEDGGPLAGVRVDVLHHPELGRTESRGDGAFDLAVAPGEELVIRFSFEGYIDAQRTVRSYAGSYASTLNLEMLRVAPGTMVDVRAGGVVRSDISEDADGSRSATILFPAGTNARVRETDGTMIPANSVRIRPREFTVGERGPARMVSTLPPTSAYTYAIELGVNDGEDVFFDRPVPVYVNDFLGMPVGTPVPVGSYDRQKGQWIPEDDGLVVEITDIRDGIASLDIDGDGAADDLTSLGIDEEERRALASEHAAGARLWRFAPTHFSPWDLNWPFGFPPNAILPALASLIGGDEFLQDSCVPGSQIRVQRQILGEQVGVVGTGMSLHYSSDRHPAYEAPRRIRLQITPDEIPESLLEVRVELDVAGQQHRQTFRPAPGLVYEHSWNGFDRFGRAYRGPAPYVLRVGYVYDGDYTTAGSEGGGLGPGFGRGGSSATGSETREEIVAWQETHGIVRFNDALTNGLHGLTLSVHHRYEPLGEMLLLGNGSTVRGAGVPRIIERVAGVADGSTVPPSSGAPADERSFDNVAGVAISPDGHVYFSERSAHRIWRVEDDGTLTIAAGTGTEGISGDGGPAINAEITRPGNLTFGPGGSLYFTSPAFAASPSTRIIRRIDVDGTIHRVAGTGERGDAVEAEGDGLLAVDTPLESPQHLAFSPDGALYFVDGLSTIRMIDTAGRLRTLNPRATREFGLDADATPLAQADLGAVGAFATDHDGTFYIGNLDGVVFRVGPDRLIFRVAGGGDFDFDRALGPNPALAVRLGPIGALAPSNDGAVWVLDGSSRLTRLIGGSLVFASGTTVGAWPSGDGGPAAAASLTNVAQLAVDDEARLVLAESFPADQIRRIRTGFGARDSDEWVIPSSDGTLRYLFDIEGRHLRTETSLTGALVHEFAYNDEGQLRSITDADGNAIVIERSERDIVVRPTQGPPTHLIDEDGDLYVDRVVTDGDAHDTRFTWRGEGQLVRFTDRIGVVHEFDYDSIGRLTLDGIVGGARQRIERVGDAVTLTTGGGRAATWGSDGTLGERTQRYTDASGVTMERSTNDEGVQTTRYDDGSEIVVVLRPDDLLGPGVSIPVSTIVRTPSGRQVEWALEQESTTVEGDLVDRVTRIITGVGTPREALTRQRLAVTADGGNVFEMTSAEGRHGTMVRNAGGELVEITQPGRFPVHLEYDDRGRLVRALQGPEGRPEEARVLSWTLPTIPSESFGDVEVEDSTGRSVRAGFDARGRTDEVSDEVGTAGFGFDEAARTLTVTPPGQEAHSFGFDSRGFMENYVPPGVAGSASEGTETFEFDDDGIPLAMNFAGSEVSVDVDNAFRGRGASFGAGTSSVVDFNENGDVSSRRWIQPEGEVRIESSYDGPLVTSVEMSGAVNATFTPEYDDTLELVATSISAGGESARSSWTRDADGITDGMTLTTSSSSVIPLTLDPRSGDLTAMRSGSAASNYDIDGFGSLESARHSWPGGSIVFGYGRDRAGRTESIVETDRAERTFDFDARGRLTATSDDGTERYGYDYDANGNRIGWRLPAGTCEGAACTEYDEQDRLLRYGNGAAQVTYRYNGAGMRTERTDSSGTTRYNYDSLGHLNGVTLPGGDEASYLHDPSGSRTTRSVNGTRTTAWLQAGGRISAQLDAAGALEVLYAYVTKSWVPDWALHRDGRLFRVITDHVGSVRLVVDADTGEVAQQYRYSPYGVLEEDTTNEAIVPHRFAGGHYDEATGLLRFGARDYDPQIGRWTNKDPLGFAAGDTNLYAYVGADPVNGVDPSGLFVDTLTDGIAVAGCLFALARDNIYGSCDNLGSNLGNCAIAAAAFVLPFVSYGMLGLGKRLGRRTSRAPDMPCGAGLCPCFVAGTVVATLAMSSIAGADAYVDSNAPIETLQVGARVQTALTDEHDTRQSEVTPDWQVIDVELGDIETDSQVLLTVLRPPEWLEAVDPNGDGTFELELPELRLQGLAHVINVRGPPVVSDAPGRVVLATVEHSVQSVLALTFGNDEDDDSDVVTTPNHPFYSVSRGWTAAGELQLGEAVETQDGERTLVFTEYQDAPQSVFNLQVEGDHEYLVGESGLRVHNTYPTGARTAAAAGISPGHARRIQNAANRTRQRITVVGSRANGTAGVHSDWDYIMSGRSRARHSARSSVPHGRSGGELDSVGRETGIDLWQDYNSSGIGYNTLSPSRPHVVFDPE